MAELFELGKPIDLRSSNPILFHGTVPYGGKDGAAISINDRSFGVIGSCFLYSDSQSAHAELLLKKIFSIIGDPSSPTHLRERHANVETSFPLYFSILRPSVRARNTAIRSTRPCSRSPAVAARNNQGPSGCRLRQAIRHTILAYAPIRPLIAQRNAAIQRRASFTIRVFPAAEASS